MRNVLLAFLGCLERFSFTDAALLLKGTLEDESLAAIHNIIAPLLLFTAAEDAYEKMMHLHPKHAAADDDSDEDEASLAEVFGKALDDLRQVVLVMNTVALHAESREDRRQAKFISRFCSQLCECARMRIALLSIYRALATSETSLLSYETLAARVERSRSHVELELTHAHMTQLKTALLSESAILNHVMTAEYCLSSGDIKTALLHVYLAKMEVDSWPQKLPIDLCEFPILWDFLRSYVAKAAAKVSLFATSILNSSPFEDEKLSLQSLMSAPENPLLHQIGEFMRDIESIRAILLVRIPPTTSESTERSTPPVEILVRVDAESASLVKMSDKDREKQSIQIGETLSQQLYRVHNYRYSPFDLDAEIGSDLFLVGSSIGTNVVALFLMESGEKVTEAKNFLKSFARSIRRVPLREIVDSE